MARLKYFDFFRSLLRQIRPQLPMIYMSAYPEWRESPPVKGQQFRVWESHSRH
jgi:hypothetical protein